MQEKHPKPEPNLNLACNWRGVGVGNEKGELYLTLPAPMHFLHGVIKGNQREGTIEKKKKGYITG